MPWSPWLPRDRRVTFKARSMVLHFCAWTLLFSPALLQGISTKSVLLVPAAAFLFWPLVAHRFLQAIALTALLLIGLINILHHSFFGYLADEFFIATTLRTNTQELREFLGTIPTSAMLPAAVWIAVVAIVARLLWQRDPSPSSRPSSLKVSYGCAIAVWCAFFTWGLVKHFDSKTLLDKVDRIYPMHLAQAALRQSELTDAIFYTPLLPVAPPQTQRVSTLVVVLGESATAHRWSLLGYPGADTNAPLAALPGVAVARVMTHGANTAAALPFMLTGLSAAHSAEQRAPAFIDLARHAHYKTFVFSNSRFDDAAEDFYSQTLRRSADVYAKAGNGAWDEVLTSHLQTALQDPAPYKLIVLHTYGSHPKVQERYPAPAARFADPYDNSVHYTSGLLREWIELVNKMGQGPSMLLYASDHGLATPPCSETYRTGYSVSSHEVPLLIWRKSFDSKPLSGVLQHTGRDHAAKVQYTNALIPALAMDAMGYAETSTPQPWASSRSVQHQGRPWSTVRSGNACNVQR